MTNAKPGSEWWLVWFRLGFGRIRILLAYLSTLVTSVVCTRHAKGLQGRAFKCQLGPPVLHDPAHVPAATAQLGPFPRDPVGPQLGPSWAPFPYFY